jgi:atypical dual specificity phosphatase
MPPSGLHRVQPTTPVLETDNWGVAYGDKVILTGLQLQIVPRAITALMGPAGGGKSTLLRSLAGLNDENPRFVQWGQLRYAGQPLAGEHRPHLVRQHVRLMQASVQDSLSELLQLAHPLSGLDRRAWCEAYLERMGFADIKPMLAQPAIELSPLHQRAIAILREAAAEPALLMCDEPTADLQDYDSYLLLELLKRLARERAVLLVTHNQRHAHKVADHVLLLAGGAVQETSRAEPFFSAPYSPAGQQFVRSGSCAVVVPELSVQEAMQAEPAPAAAAAVPAPTAAQAARQSQRAVLPDLALANPVLAAAHYVPGARGPRGFAWLVPGKLAGTPLPGVVNDVDVDMQALKRCGITVLVSLTENDIDQAALARHGLRNVHLPVHDREPPSVSQLQMLMLKMKRLLLDGEVLAVHCLAGLGRTGTVLAAWLVFEGVTADEALRRVRVIEPQYVQSERQENALSAYEEMLLEKMG